MMTTFLICIAIAAAVAMLNRKKNSWTYPGYPEHEAVYREMAWYNTDELAKYAEIDIDYFNVMQEDEMQKRLDNPQYEKWNSSSVGNIAFIIENHPDPKVRQLAEEVLQEWRSWAEQNL